MPQYAVELKPHSEEWKWAAEREASRFRELLGENAIAIHHIGSTSIPDILAKPVIDLTPVVRDLDELDQAELRIRAAGYSWWGEFGIVGRRFCTLIDHATDRRIANIHCFLAESPDIDRHLAFRDYLRAFPEKARKYEAEKLLCQQLHPNDTGAYADAKAAWIKAVEREALLWFHSKQQSALPQLFPAD